MAPDKQNITDIELATPEMTEKLVRGCVPRDDSKAEAMLETEEQLFARLDSEVADFFEVDPLEPKIVTYKLKEDLHRAWVEADSDDTSEAPDWIVAFATYSNIIHILSSDVMPPWEGIMDGPTRYKKTVKHEISHLYQNLINKAIPPWLSEGVSLFVAGQDYYQQMRPGELSIELLDELDNAPTDERIYRVGINMVNMIMAHFGKEKLFEIMAIKDKNDRYAELQRMLPWLK